MHLLVGTYRNRFIQWINIENFIADDRSIDLRQWFGKLIEEGGIEDCWWFMNSRNIERASTIS